jgi:hypothetical protein
VFREAQGPPACVGWSKAFVTVTVLFTLIDGTSRWISANLSCDSVVYSCLMTKMRPCRALVPPSWPDGFPHLFTVIRVLRLIYYIYIWLTYKVFSRKFLVILILIREKKKEKLPITIIMKKLD